MAVAAAASLQREEAETGHLLAPADTVEGLRGSGCPGYRLRILRLLLAPAALVAFLGATSVPLPCLRPHGCTGSNTPAALGSAVSDQLLSVSSNANTHRPVNLTFYIYRAQSDENYPLENINAADLPGVMWYLHNEIVGFGVGVQRKYNVTRILRYKLTTQSTRALFDAYKTQFGPYVAYDSGICTTPACINTFKQYGYNVGCQLTAAGAYVSTFQTSEGCRLGLDCKPVWYSLPGACPNTPLVGKNDACANVEPGGHCTASRLDRLGEADCTYSYETAGEVRLEELLELGGSDSYDAWVRRGGKEYDKATDQGTYTTFWNWINDKKACQRRVKVVASLFRSKYPSLPDTYGEPPCSFS